LEQPPAKIKKEKKTKVSKANKKPIYDKLPRPFLVEFIAIYKAHECLWKPKSADYYNRKVKRAAWQKLIEKYREIEPNPNKMTIRSKIATLRTSFRREYLRVQKSEDTWQPHKPKLWYYDMISFIAVDPSIATADCQPDKVNMKEEIIDDQLDSNNEDKDENDCTQDSSSSEDSNDPLLVAMDKPRETRKRSSRVAESPPPLKKTYEEVGKNEHDLFGQTIAAKIKNMSVNQQILAEKLIFDVLCFGRMERLEMETSIENLKKV
jgi:Alcohol dehydrogenase transcription factor Myb/SANT-like